MRKVLLIKTLNFVYKPFSDGRTYKEIGLESVGKKKPADALVLSGSRYENRESKDYLQPGTFVGSQLGRHFRTFANKPSSRPGFSHVLHSLPQVGSHCLVGAQGT
jgi:hypothetical protein